MDLGATICRPREPRCDACPVREDCAAHATGDPASYPPRPARKEKPERHGIVWWIEQGGAVFLVRRPDKGLLGGMAALPGTDWIDGAPPPASGDTITHGFTHFRLTLAVEKRADPPDDATGWWQPLDRLDEAGLPTLYAKAARLALARQKSLPLTP